MKTWIAAFAATMILAGCASSETDMASRAPASESFKAYPDVNHKPNKTGCDSYTQVELSIQGDHGTISLRSAVSGANCKQMPAQDARSYALQRDRAGEGEVHFTSTRLLSQAPGPRKFRSATVQQFQMKGASSTTISETEATGAQTALYRAD